MYGGCLVVLGGCLGGDHKIALNKLNIKQFFQNFSLLLLIGGCLGRDHKIEDLLINMCWNA